MFKTDTGGHSKIAWATRLNLDLKQKQTKKLGKLQNMASLRVGLSLGGVATELGPPMCCACWEGVWPVGLYHCARSRSLPSCASVSRQIVPRVSAIGRGFSPVKVCTFLTEAAINTISSPIGHY